MWTPEWARSVRFEARRGRYEKREVDSAFAQFLDSYEQVWNERDELRVAVAALEEETAMMRELERGLRDAIVRGQRIADEICEEAVAERDRMFEAARAEVDNRRADAEEEIRGLHEEITRLAEARDELKRNFETVVLAGVELLERFEATSDRETIADGDSGRSHRLMPANPLAGESATTS